jgi:hypothetical protein
MPVASGSQTPTTSVEERPKFRFTMEGDAAAHVEEHDYVLDVLQDSNMEEVLPDASKNKSKAKAVREGPVIISRKTKDGTPARANSSAKTRHRSSGRTTAVVPTARPRRAAASAKPQPHRTTRSSSSGGQTRGKKRRYTPEENETDETDAEPSDSSSVATDDDGDDSNLPPTPVVDAPIQPRTPAASGRVLRTRVPKSAERLQAEREAERAYRAAIAG